MPETKALLPVEKCFSKKLFPTCTIMVDVTPFATEIIPFTPFLLYINFASATIRRI